jgi:hypothetical protein
MLKVVSEFINRNSCSRVEGESQPQTIKVRGSALIGAFQSKVGGGGREGHV